MVKFAFIVLMAVAITLFCTGFLLVVLKVVSVVKFSFIALIAPVQVPSPIPDMLVSPKSLL